MNTDDSQAKIWKVPAANMARDGATPQRIATFLRTKGVPEKDAIELAESLCLEAKKKIQPAKLIQKFVGWTFIVIGLAVTIGSFFSAMISGGLILIPGGLVLLGCGILWAPELLGIHSSEN